MKRGAQIIAAERRRQVEREGWDSSHDDTHDEGEMVQAAICYAEAGRAAARGFKMEHIYGATFGGITEITPPPHWPNEWDHDYWKPSDDAIKNLRRAGALIAAEIDRLLRAKRRASPQRDTEGAR